MRNPRLGVIASSVPNTPARVFDAIMSLSPYSYWPLREDSGSTAFDYGSYGLNGTYEAGVTLGSVVGADGYEYPSFPGSNNGAVNVGDAPGYSIGIGLTVFALIRPSSFIPVYRRPIVTRAGPSLGQYEWEFDAGPTEDLTVTILKSTSSTSSAWVSRGGTIVSAGEWTAVAFSCSSTNVIVAETLYVNSSVPESIRTGGFGSGGSVTDTTSNLVIGGRADNNSQIVFPGSISHVALWNAVLTSEQIAIPMNAALSEGWIA
jgi:Concanavalin A-like lectin/glucanases superfamily